MVLLLPHKLSVDNLVALVSNKVVQRLDDGTEVDAFGYRVDAVLALRTPVVIVRAFEDEAHALGHETDVASFSPTQQVKGDLSQTIVLAHVVHGIPPAVESGVEGFRASGFPTFYALQALKPRILGLTNGVIEIELSSKVPLAVIGVLSTNVVGVDSEEGLVRAHSRSPRVQQLHEEVELDTL